MKHEPLLPTHCDDRTATTSEKCEHTSISYDQAFIDKTVQRANKYRKYTRWVATTCSVLTIACLRYCLLSSDVWIVPSPYAIFCLPLPAMALMEVLLYTGMSVAVPVSGRKIEVIPRVLPNDAETAWYFEGEGAWPCQRQAVSTWWKGVGQGRGWRQCFTDSGFALVAAYSGFMLACLLWTWMEIMDLRRRMER